MRRKAFLKWAGGKYRVLDAILEEIPRHSRFVEPFAGSCTVYLNVPSAKALICDINQDLIALYRQLQEEGESFITYCRSFFTRENNAKERFLALREEFNAASEARVRSALLLYLNRHAYNGLVRYNSGGGYNVPFGRYASPYFPLRELQDFYRKTQETETRFVCKDFRELFAELLPGDVVYCDPPYVPLSVTANFTSYAGKAFSAQDQRDLAGLAQAAQHRGITLILSNHDTKDTRELYATAERKHFTVRRSISRTGSGRGGVPEMLAIYR